MFHPVAVIVLIRPGTKLDLLDGDDYLLLFCLVRPLLSFVLKLPEVDDLANRGISVRGNFDEIQPLFAGGANGLASVHHSELFTVFADDAYLWDANSFVNASDRRAPKFRAATPSKPCSYCCTSSV